MPDTVLFRRLDKFHGDAVSVPRIDNPAALVRPVMEILRLTKRPDAGVLGCGDNSVNIINVEGNMGKSAIAGP